MPYVILIPSYEPDEQLINLLKEIDNKYPVVIVNDGSDKSFNRIFKEASQYAHIISYNENMGKGYALKTGLNYIDDTYDKYIVVTMDSDGQHKLSDAIKLCNYIKEHNEQLALGRRTWDKTMPLRSRLGNGITRVIFKWMTKAKIYDTQSGLRAFSYKLTDYMLNIQGNRYEYEMNVLLNLKDSHIKYHEIKTATIYINNNEASHFNTIKDSYKIYKAIFKWHNHHRKVNK